MFERGDLGIALRTGPGFNAILQSLMKIIAKLSAMSREELQTSAAVGEVKDASAPDIVGIHGFTLRSLPGGSGFLLDSFGNVRVDEESGAAVVMSVREPITEVRIADRTMTIRAEVPGVPASDVRFELREDRLVLRAESGERNYRKEIQLVRPCREAAAKLTGRDGVVEIQVSLA